MGDNSIPKIIHYCWFGGKPIPTELQKCIDSWSILKGYKIMRWDESNCSFDENLFVKKTFAERKLGFIGDYYRLKAVYEYGGIYLDTDVLVNRTFDDLLDVPAFINFIFDDSVGTAIIGSRPGNPFIKALMDMYDSVIFDKTDNGKEFERRSDGTVVLDDMTTSNYFFTYYILKNYPQFKLNNRYQNLGDFVIYPKELFEIGTLSNKHYAIHLCAGEWQLKDELKSTLRGRAKELVKKNSFLFGKIQILVRKNRYRKMKKSIPFYSYYLAQKKNTKLPEL